MKPLLRKPFGSHGEAWKAQARTNLHDCECEVNIQTVKRMLKIGGST